MQFYPDLPHIPIFINNLITLNQSIQNVSSDKLSPEAICHMCLHLSPASTPTLLLLSTVAPLCQEERLLKSN